MKYLYHRCDTSCMQVLSSDDYSRSNDIKDNNTRCILNYPKPIQQFSFFDEFGIKLKLYHKYFKFIIQLKTGVMWHRRITQGFLNILFEN